MYYFHLPIYAEWKKGLDWMADLFLVGNLTMHLRQVKDAAEDLSINPTFFETTFLATMIVTAEIKPKFLILETGLGGRLDATRCAPADLSILTSITKEHTDILGTTFTK